MRDNRTNYRLITAIVVGAVAAGVAFALMTPAATVNKNIGNEELVQLQTEGAWLVDVRTNSEFIAGHIPNSLSVPLDQLPQVAAQWNKGQPIILYCATGARSASAAAYLQSQGFSEVYNLEKGIVAWSGEVIGGAPSASIPTGPGTVKTSGKPLFIDFAGSN